MIRIILFGSISLMLASLGETGCREGNPGWVRVFDVEVEDGEETTTVKRVGAFIDGRTFVLPAIEGATDVRFEDNANRVEELDSDCSDEHTKSYALRNVDGLKPSVTQAIGNTDPVCEGINAHNHTVAFVDPALKTIKFKRIRCIKEDDEPLFCTKRGIPDAGIGSAILKRDPLKGGLTLYGFATGIRNNIDNVLTISPVAGVKTTVAASLACRPY